MIDVFIVSFLVVFAVIYLRSHCKN